MKHSLVVTATTLMMLALAACGEDPEPRFAPPEKSSPTEQPSESPTSPPTSPPVTDDPKPLSPEETVRAWVQARNVLVRTGDIGPVNALNAESCLSCAGQLDPVLAVHENGGYLRTRGWIIDDTAENPDFATTGKVVAALTFDRGETLPEAGAEIIRYGFEKHIIEFRLKLEAGSWLVNDIVYLP